MYSRGEILYYGNTSRVNCQHSVDPRCPRSNDQTARYCKRSSLGLFGSGNETRDGYRCIPDWRSMHPGWRSQYPWMVIKDGDRCTRDVHRYAMHPWLAINHPRMTIDASRDRISRDGIPGMVNMHTGNMHPGMQRSLHPGMASTHPRMSIDASRVHGCFLIGT